jgi:hypothetical protein
VTAAFNALHVYLNDQVQFSAVTNAVHLGDYIDLYNLTVAATPQTEAGTQDMTDARRGGISASNAVLEGHGTLLRLMVVGINSFNRRTTEPAGHVDTPHVVFQFQNVPGTHRINATDTNATSYLNSEMRAYLTGNFLDGLKLAGVPETVLWGPKRLIWKGWADSENQQVGTHEITDTLWLPTEREISGDGPYLSNITANRTYETASNQAHFEYYDGYDKRVKYNSANSKINYYDASPQIGSMIHACLIGENGSVGFTNAATVFGCAPAFCVR